MGDTRRLDDREVQLDREITAIMADLENKVAERKQIRDIKRGRYRAPLSPEERRSRFRLIQGGAVAALVGAGAAWAAEAFRRPALYAVTGTGTMAVAGFAFLSPLDEPGGHGWGTPPAPVVVTVPPAGDEPGTPQQWRPEPEPQPEPTVVAQNTYYVDAPAAEPDVEIDEPELELEFEPVEPDESDVEAEVEVEVTVTPTPKPTVSAEVELSPQELCAEFGIPALNLNACLRHLERLGLL